MTVFPYQPKEQYRRKKLLPLFAHVLLLVEKFKLFSLNEQPWVHDMVRRSDFSASWTDTLSSAHIAIGFPQNQDIKEEVRLSSSLHRINQQIYLLTRGEKTAAHGCLKKNCTVLLVKFADRILCWLAGILTLV